MCRKEGALLCPFCGELGPRLIQRGLGRALLPYQVASSSIQPCGHNRHEPETGGCAPFRAKLRPHLTQRRLAEVHLRTKWHLDLSSRLATIYMGQKLGGVSFLGAAGSPSNTKSPGPRPTSTPSGILVHPAVWPQRTLAEIWGAVPR